MKFNEYISRPDDAPYFRDPEDCTINVIAFITGKTWLQCFDILCKKAKELYLMPEHIDCFKGVLEDMNYKYSYERKKINLNKWVATHDKGLYIMDFDGHVSIVKDGIEYGFTPSSNRYVIGYWQKAKGK